MAKDNDILQYILRGKDDCKGMKIGFGDSLIEFIAQDSTNKLDSRSQLINGEELDTALPAPILEVLKTSK